jgi:hypothetical protein
MFCSAWQTGPSKHILLVPAMTGGQIGLVRRSGERTSTWDCQCTLRQGERSNGPHFLFQLSPPPEILVKRSPLQHRNAQHGLSATRLLRAKHGQSSMRSSGRARTPLTAVTALETAGAGDVSIIPKTL